MKYRHGFHAGNFADVHKHVTLLALLRALQRKDKGLLYLDTHAGAGRYDLAGAETHHGAEARSGFAALSTQAGPLAPELADYLRQMKSAADAVDNLHLYAGSPLLAAQVLRPQDRGVCFEIQPPESRALERALHGHRHLRVQCADGLEQFAAWLPPPERRALVLIDPPYEDTRAELAGALQAARQMLDRLANAVILLWYPIKDERLLAPWLTQAGALLAAPTLKSELWIYPRDSRVSLNGSGLLIVNPPWQTDRQMSEWLPQLAQALDVQHHGGSSQEWLIPEPA